MDFLRHLFGGDSETPTTATVSAAVADAPAVVSAPVSVPAVGAGGARSPTTAPAPAMAPRLDGARGPRAAKQKPSKRELELQADRLKAQKELRSRFQIVGPDTKDGGDRLPNQLTRAEFENVARMYSDVRMGDSFLKIRDSKEQGIDPKMAKHFKDETMNDIAAILQTKSGRDLVAQLDAGVVGGEGDVHSTTIQVAPPLRTGTLAADSEQKPNMFATGNGRGAGADMKVQYAPGLEYEDEVKKNPWSPIRSDVALFHELTHALHANRGDMHPENASPTKDQCMPGDYPGQHLSEEYATVGLGSHAGDRVTENAYRAERRRLAGHRGAREGDEKPSMGRRERYLN